MVVVRASETLAIDPARRSFGWAVLDSSEILLDWGEASVFPGNHQKVLEYIEVLVARHGVVRLVLEDMGDTRRRGRASSVIRHLVEYGERASIEVVVVTRAKVKDTFASSGKTKYQIARALSRLFPELASRLPRARRVQDVEPEGMAVFNAISFAHTVLYRLERARYRMYEEGKDV